jgi:4-amino-4-deoxy-L-arabinose transferase-like glycosyltransferase
MLQKIEQSAFLTLLFFLVIGTLIRLFSFFPTVIDHDESTYIVISDALIKGQTYFVDVIDTKPVGVFLLYAGLQKLVGDSIFMLRLAATIFLVLTAFLLYLAMKKTGGTARAGIAAGLIYLIMNSIFTYYGVSPNTETFFNFFTALALWLWISEERSWIYPLAGLSLGAGFLIKYVVAFDALAFGLLMLWMALRKKRAWGKTILQAGLMLIGFLVPFGWAVAYYSNLGHLDTFFFYTLEVSSRYPDAARPWDYIKFFFDFNLRFLPVALLAFFAIRSSSANTYIATFGLLWISLVWVVVLLPGKFFAHYCIQVMLPLSFLAGAFWNIPKEDRPRWLRAVTSSKVGWILLALLLGLNIFFQKKDYFDKKDYPKEIAAWLRTELREGETFYVGNYEQVLYHLLDQPSPIPYVHSSLVWRRNHTEALKVDTEKIMSQLKQQAPRFIFRKKSDRDNDLPIGQWLEQEYELVKTYNEEIFIFGRR